MLPAPDDPRTYRYNALHQITHVNDVRVEKLVASCFHVIVTRGPDWDRSGFADQDQMKFGVIAVPNRGMLREWCREWLNSRGSDGWTPWTSVAVMWGAEAEETLYYKVGDRKSSLEHTSSTGAHDVAVPSTKHVFLRMSRGRQQKQLARLAVLMSTKHDSLRTSRAKVLKEIVVAANKNRAVFNRVCAQFRKFAFECAGDYSVTNAEVESLLAEAERGFMQDRRSLLRRARGLLAGSG